MREMEPTELVFWGVMSLGVMAGFMLAYPFNVWMVSQKLKHSLMTERKPGCKFDGVIAAEQEMQVDENARAVKTDKKSRHKDCIALWLL